MQDQNRFRQTIAFRYSPLLDMALAALVLEDPERFGGSADWAPRLMRRLPEGLLDRLHAAAERVDLFRLALELEGDTPQPVPELLSRLGAKDSALADILQECWEAISPEVAAQAGLLLASAQSEQAQLARMDPLAFIGRFSDRVGVSGDGEAIVLHWGGGMRIPLADLDQILFVPSAFCPRRLMFYRVGRTQVFFYSPRSQEPRAVDEAPESLTLGFTALADATRLRLLRLVAREDLPAQEMAQRLGVTESTVSRHLRVLTEAGLVGRQRQEGKFVFYDLQTERIDRLTAGLKTYLGRD
ncbi:MAG: ArsR/SmtB family transcription factor [Symbiobacteriia bacterium]